MNYGDDAVSGHLAVEPDLHDDGEHDDGHGEHPERRHAHGRARLGHVLSCVAIFISI